MPAMPRAWWAFLFAGTRMRKPTALGANIFAGGFTLGVSKHFKILGHLEHDDYGAQVASKNLRIPIHVGKESWPLKLPVRLDFLYSNPPCAVWSAASSVNRGGVNDNWKKDPRLQRIRDIFALVDIYKPKVWCWESVCQAFERGRSFVEQIATAAADRGYSATYLLIDAQYLNTPQVRKRFFLVLHNVEIDWQAATPEFKNTMTPAQALRGVKPIKRFMHAGQNRFLDDKKLLPLTKPGEKLRDVFDRVNKKIKRGKKGQVVGRPSFAKRRLDPSKPCPVVFGDHLYHPKEHRLLALNEIGALYGFPQEWDWIGNKNRLLPQRGVLPNVGEWLARHVAKAIRKGRPIRRPYRLLVDFRRPPGTIIPVNRLPATVDLDWCPERVGKGGQKQG